MRFPKPLNRSYMQIFLSFIIFGDFYEKIGFLPKELGFNRNFSDKIGK
jgi:hypothetical protein